MLMKNWTNNPPLWVGHVTQSSPSTSIAERGIPWPNVSSSPFISWEKYSSTWRQSIHKGVETCFSKRMEYQSSRRTVSTWIPVLPRTMPLSHSSWWKNDCKYHFGSYSQAFDDPDGTVTNAQQLCSRTTFCLGSKGNMQRLYYFLAVDMKTVVKWREFAEFPILDSIKQRIEAWGEKGQTIGRLIPFECSYDDQEYLPNIMSQMPWKQCIKVSKISYQVCQWKAMCQQSRTQKLQR